MDGPRILVADDDFDDHSILSEAFSDFGYADSVKIMDGGQSLINYLKETQGNIISLIVLDLNMPILDGIETLKLLKAGPFRNIPVVIFSTSASEKDKNVCLESGAIEFITKPRFLSEYRNICVKLYLMAYHPLI